MYCTNCGTEIAEGAKFCSNCGTRLEAPAQPEAPAESQAAPAAAGSAVQEEAAAKRPSFAEFEWHVEDYPNREGAEKTEAVNFNWNASPDEVSETVKKPAADDVLRGEDLERALFGQLQAEKRPEELSAAERIDKFYTFNKKNEEFQKLINNEYQRVKSGNAIEHELFEADKLAQERFDSRPELSSMESFLEREGIVKPYQPKEFQSDVLQRIEAQEAEREAKRLEEEARLAAIEEARIEAEMKKRAEEEAALRAEAERKAEELARQQEEARLRAEEEARLKAEEEARIRAEEAAELARRQAEAEELARLRAAEEARLRAEEEAKLRAEAEARLRAEEEARFKAEEEARLKAEADLRAAQEAAKIRAQQEARLAAEAEAQFKAEQERRKLESEEAQRRLEEKRRKLTEEANEAVAQEEIRKVLEQTARMREEEAAKIRAAVAGLRSGVGAAAAAQAAAESAEIKEAHQATRDQINEMAKARDAFFADMEPFEDVKPAEKVEEPVITEPVIQHITGRETMLSNDLAKTRVIDKAAIIAGLNEPTRVASAPAEPAPASDDDFFRSLEEASVDPFVEELPEIGEMAEIEEAVQEEPQPVDFKEETEEEAVNELDDLLSQFESVNDLAAEEASAEEPAEVNSGLEDTVLMTGNDAADKFSANDFDSYGNEEAERFRSQQRLQSSTDDFYGDDLGSDDAEPAVPLTKKEQKQRAKEQKRLEKEQAQEAKAAKKREKKNQMDDEEEQEPGGKGRIVLKIILVLLIVILVIEVAGMGIRFLAPNSGAAEFIDNQLNKVIHMVTGEDESVEYTVETKTDESTAPAESVPADDAGTQDGDAAGTN